eukprot:830230_1
MDLSAHSMTTKLLLVFLATSILFPTANCAVSAKRTVVDTGMKNVHVTKAIIEGAKIILVVVEHSGLRIHVVRTKGLILQGTANILYWPFGSDIRERAIDLSLSV